MRVREITEKCLDLIIDTRLFEMARERSDAINKVDGVSNPIIYHLIYLHLYPKAQTVAHWKKELNTFLATADDLWLKPTGKRKLSGADYYKLLFENPLEGDIVQLESRVRKAIRKEGQPTIPVDLPRLKEILEKTLHRLSFDLANDKFTDINDYLENF